MDQIGLGVDPHKRSAFISPIDESVFVAFIRRSLAAPGIAKYSCVLSYEVI